MSAGVQALVHGVVKTSYVLLFMFITGADLQSLTTADQTEVDALKVQAKQVCLDVYNP
jgi:hypothetical protein